MTAATTPSERWRLGYRPELDGLRGVAILAVLLSHAGFPVPGGGIVGVTLFFVLSGFLITSLLLDERAERGRVSLVDFYVRRALRLLPALVVMVGVVTAIQIAFAAQSDPLRDAAAALSYAGNWSIISSGDIGLLHHTWSLAVEEQFYVLWPLLFLLLIRWPRAMLGLLCVAAAGALALRVDMVLTGAPLHRVANGSDTRADALIAGCILALLVARGWRPPSRLASVAVFGLAACVLAVGYSPIGLTFGLAATTVLATLAVAGAGRPAGWLRWAPLRRTGRISYGIYLWHVPLMFGMLVHATAIPLAVRIIGGIAMSIALAELSYRWVELPFLRLKPAPGRITLRRWAGLATAAAVLVVAMGLALGSGALAAGDGNPMTRALLVSAGIDVHAQLDALESSHQQTGWGSGQAWDAFADGTINDPAVTTYGITTAFVIQAYLDAGNADRDLAEAAVAWARCCWDDSGFFWYSNQPHDGIDTPNVSAMLAGTTYRLISERPDLFSLPERTLVAGRADAAVAHLVASGHPQWPYSAHDPAAINDLMHQGYILWGLELYRSFGGSVAIPWSREDAAASLDAIDFLGLWPAAGPAMRYAFDACFAPSSRNQQDLVTMADNPRDEAHRLWARAVANDCPSSPQAVTSAAQRVR